MSLATKQTVFAVEEVEPFVGDTLENARYRACDYCFETAMEDVCKSIPMRAYYYALDGSDLSVCEHCLLHHFFGEQQGVS